MNRETHLLPDGSTLSYTELGSGPVLLMLHGVLASSRFFERNLQPLAEHFRIIAVDLRGHGESPSGEGGNTVPQMARDLRDLILALDLHAVTALGWSMGNMVIWDYLAQFPEDSRIAAQICVSQGPSDLSADGWTIGFTDPPGLRDLLRSTQEDFVGVCRYVATILTKELPGEADLQWMVDEQLKTGSNVATCILADQTQRDYREVVGGFGLPVLAVWGADEKCLPVASGEWLEDTMPDVELHVFDDSGHMPMWEEPDRFNRLVVDWATRRNLLKTDGR